MSGYSPSYSSSSSDRASPGPTSSHSSRESFRKRRAESESLFLPLAKRKPSGRSVTVTTVEKWKKTYDKELQTSLWLAYERAEDRNQVRSLVCSICRKFESKLRGIKHFSRAFVDGSTNLKTSSFKDHASSTMHSRALVLLRKEQSESSGSSCVTDYSPIARALSVLDKDTKAKLVKKFQIAYMIAKENMAFKKMEPLCQLEKLHGVELGHEYLNNQACADFIDFIGLDQRQILAHTLSNTNFFSLQADGSTDSGNIEDELFLVVFFDKNSQGRQVRIRNKFFSVRTPKSGDAVGLYQCLKDSFSFVGVQDSDWQKKLIGFGCDGTNVNIADGGVKGYLRRDLPWIEVI